MHIRLAGMILVGVAWLIGSVHAAPNDVVLQGQTPAPQPSQPPQPDAPPPTPRIFPRNPATPPFPLPSRQTPAAGSCVHYTMKLIPANPSIDPKFARPVPDTGIRYSGREVPIAPRACR